MPITKKYNSRISYKIPKILKNIINTSKDKIKKLSHCDIVYKINCSGCKASYVEQTKRQLRTRVKEHIVDIRKKSRNLSIVFCHRLETDHEFNWENVQILDRALLQQKAYFRDNPYFKKPEI